MMQGGVKVMLNNSVIDLSWSGVRIEKGIKDATLGYPEQKKVKTFGQKFN